MELTVFSVTEEAFKIAIAEGIHEAQDSRDCSNYVVPFGQRVSELEDKDADASNAFRLLSILSTLRLDPDDPDDPFRPGMIATESRTPIVEDLPENLIDVIEKAASAPGDPELRARLCDICWIRRRNRHLATAAVPAYIEAGRNILSSARSLHWKERFERALQIAKSLNQDSLQDSAEDALRTLALHQDTEAHAVATAIELLHTYSRNRGRDIADRAIEMAERPEATLIWQERFYGLAARCYRRSGFDEESRSAATSQAEVFVLQATEALDRPHGGHAVAAQFLERAIQAFRRITGTETRREELHRQLLGHQKQMPGELFTAATDGLDVSEHAQLATNEVAGSRSQRRCRFLHCPVAAPTETNFEASQSN